MFGLTFKSRLLDTQEKINEETKLRKELREELQETESELESVESDYKSTLDAANLDKLPKYRYTKIELEEPRVAWKRTEEHIAELIIPAGTTVVYPYIKAKLRVGRAYVRDIQTPLFNSANETEDHSYHENDFTYTQGEFVEPDKLDENLGITCTNGIHVFRTKERAKGYSQWYNTKYEEVMER